VEISFKDIRNLEHYKEIVLEFGGRIKKTSLKIFPASGLVLLILGVATIFLFQYVKI